MFRFVFLPFCLFAVAVKGQDQWWGERDEQPPEEPLNPEVIVEEPPPPPPPPPPPAEPNTIDTFECPQPPASSCVKLISCNPTCDSCSAVPSGVGICADQWGGEGLCDYHDTYGYYCKRPCTTTADCPDSTSGCYSYTCTAGSCRRSLREDCTQTKLGSCGVSLASARNKATKKCML